MYNPPFCSLGLNQWGFCHQFYINLPIQLFPNTSPANTLCCVTGVSTLLPSLSRAPGESMIVVPFFGFALCARALCPIPMLLMLVFQRRAETVCACPHEDHYKKKLQKILCYWSCLLKPVGLLPPVGGPDQFSLQNNKFLAGLSALFGK
jgi:hypothetical protein